jgi:hypothetical protein
MRTQGILLLVVSTCLFCGSVTTAAKSDSHAFPRKITVTHPEREGDKSKASTLRCNGTSLCEWGVFGIDLYQVALYLEAPSRSEREVIESNQVKHLELRFSRSLSKKLMQRAYRASFRANTKQDTDRYEERIDQFVRLIPAVKKGDRLAFTCFPGQGLEIRLGKTMLGRIPGDDFGRLFFRLYVGPVPPTKAVRRGLLGLSGNA